MHISPTSRMPEIRHADVTAVFVSHRYVPDRACGLRELEAAVDQWDAAAWPAGLLSVSCYLSTDDDTVLVYAQCASAECYRPALGSLSGLAGLEPVEYRLRHSVVLDENGDPGSVVIATFDVDGPERQQRVIESLRATLEQAPREQHPGMLAANFHVSVDGTRVLNYAEWTSDEAHIAFLEGATRKATLRTSNSLPGVRPIGFKRYHLYRSLRP